MIHAQQKGFQPSEVFKGLCEAVARNFKSSIVKGKTFEKPVLFIGGVASNSGVVEALKCNFQSSGIGIDCSGILCLDGGHWCRNGSPERCFCLLELDISKLSRIFNIPER